MGRRRSKKKPPAPASQPTKADESAASPGTKGTDEPIEAAAFAAAEAELVERYGPHWETGGDGGALRKDNRLLSKALRWNTNFRGADASGITADDLRRMSVKELAVYIAHRQLLAPDPNVQSKAIGHVLRMEGQNQHDQANYVEPPPPPEPDEDDTPGILNAAEEMRAMMRRLRHEPTIIDVAADGVRPVAPRGPYPAQPGRNGSHAEPGELAAGGPSPAD